MRAIVDPQQVSTSGARCTSAIAPGIQRLRQVCRQVLSCRWHPAPRTSTPARARSVRA